MRKWKTRQTFLPHSSWYVCLMCPCCTGHHVNSHTCFVCRGWQIWLLMNFAQNVLIPWAKRANMFRLLLSPMHYECPSVWCTWTGPPWPRVAHRIHAIHQTALWVLIRTTLSLKDVLFRRMTYECTCCIAQATMIFCTRRISNFFLFFVTHENRVRQITTYANNIFSLKHTCFCYALQHLVEKMKQLISLSAEWASFHKSSLSSGWHAQHGVAARAHYYSLGVAEHSCSATNTWISWSGHEDMHHRGRRPWSGQQTRTLSVIAQSHLFNVHRKASLAFDIHEVWVWGLY